MSFYLTPLIWIFIPLIPTTLLSLFVSHCALIVFLTNFSLTIKYLINCFNSYWLAFSKKSSSIPNISISFINNFSFIKLIPTFF
ncbi:hypothetical protein C6B38_03215 [Spiroplasma sp. ChiS]|nr:hypothetical protein C6B38_03215 [Spiroplasma sp. ChiS]